MKNSAASAAHVEITSRSPVETEQIGRQLGALLGRIAAGLRTHALVVALHGDLGTGKTTLTKGIAAGLGVTDPVTSPTFTLIREYATPELTFVHMDSYRLGELPVGAAAEAENFGIDELLDDPAVLMVIEWAERLAGLLPADALHVQLAYAPDEEDARRIMAWCEDSASDSGWLDLLVTGALSEE